MKTIKLLFAIVFFAICSHSMSQNTGENDPTDHNTLLNNTDSPVYSKAYIKNWYPANTFPLLLDSTIYAASAIIGDTIYVQKPEWTGASTIASSNVIKYKINVHGGGSWINGRSLPAARVGGSMTACNGKIYFIGGDASNITLAGTNTVYEYSPTTGVWATKAPMPVPLAAHGSVCWGDSVIFVIGGPYNNSATCLNVYYYRPASDTWGTILNSLPAGQGRRTFAIGIDQNKIIISGGYNTTYLKSTYIGTIGSNASQITWTSAADIPTLNGYGLARPAGTACNGFFFLIGGQYGGGTPPWQYGDSTHVFEFSTNTWITVIDNKPNRGYNIFNSAVSRNEAGDTIQVYVPGNYTGQTGGTRVFDVMKFKITPDGINSISGAQKYAIYPNPSKGIINIHFYQNYGLQCTIEIRNTQGKLLFSKTSSQDNEQIDLSAYTKGMYFIQITNKFYTKTEKLIIN